LSHYADWSAGGWHPKTFTAHDITPTLLHRMRAGQQGGTAHTAGTAGTAISTACDAAAATRSATSAIFQPRVWQDGTAAAGKAADTSSSAKYSAGGDRGRSQAKGRHEQLLAIDQQQDALQEVPQPQQRLQQQLGVVGAGGWLVDAGYVPLGPHCSLFGRKFTAAVLNQTLAMALSCNGVGLGSWCPSTHGGI
jgi:hypothetical protein